jgi:hypothetical protein
MVYCKDIYAEKLEVETEEDMEGSAYGLHGDQGVEDAVEDADESSRYSNWDVHISVQRRH